MDHDECSYEQERDALRVRLAEAALTIARLNMSNAILRESVERADREIAALSRASASQDEENIAALKRLEAEHRREDIR